VKVIEAGLLADMKRNAAEAPRRRTHHNLHEDLGDAVQRVVIALEPGTYVRPHRHADGVWELFVLLDGACSVLVFDADGRVLERADLAENGARMAQVPPGAWHSILATAPGTIAFEVKPGPYRPATDKDFVPWAPAEGEAGVAAMLARLEAAAVGDRLG
jgi:cupin fold WbuC family metalloprotein